jgi:hypothetical protein
MRTRCDMVAYPKAHGTRFPVFVAFLVLTPRILVASSALLAQMYQPLREVPQMG